jgi:hypothetical protein
VLSDARRIKELVDRCLLAPIEYFQRGHNEDLYLLHRQLYVKTKGRFNSCIHDLISIVNPWRQLPFLGRELLAASNVNDVLGQMKETGGYADCSLTFSNDHLSSLVKRLDSCKALGKTSARIMIHDWRTLRNEPLVQKIINDNSIRMIANRYLNCNALLNMVTAWKTSYVHESIHNANSDAMLFHFDADHNRFLKVFVYLNDVGQHEGPHVFIPRTSSLYRKQLPEYLQRDGRFSNIELIKLGLVPQYVTGPKGTMIFADTHCLHRGTRVSQGHHRYILQFQFVDSVAGSRAAHSPEDIIEMNKGFQFQ